jgi:16S rRNA (cytidine1402-2'-O)-methyltransferase
LLCDRLVFDGCLPHKKGRKTKLEKLAEEERTVVLYESTHRILKTLKQIGEYFGKDRQAAVSRELTKKFEETVRGTLEELVQYFEENPIKGEFVIVVRGAE